MQNLQTTNREINDKMMEVYNYQKKRNYHGNEIVIVLIDVDSGASLSDYSIAATRLNNNNGSQGNAY